MKITVNGESTETDSQSLTELLAYLGYDADAVATAVNGEFVAASLRSQTELKQNDSVDVIAPMAGG